jgi:hypothetical protein
MDACRRVDVRDPSLYPASCAMVDWALSIGLIDLPFSHWTHATFKHIISALPFPLPILRFNPCVRGGAETVNIVGLAPAATATILHNDPQNIRVSAAGGCAGLDPL